MKTLKLTPQEAKELLDNLFEIAMQGRWKEVVKLYKEIPEARKKKITKSSDTALHIAVSEGQTEVALELVEIIDEEELCISNEKENTPLHIAAQLGNVEVCQSISRKIPNLFPLRNCKGETPLFLAALHGEENAFLCLIRNNYGDTIRNNNGDTILHAAISGEHFSLAFKIINYYPELVNSINVNGWSPLHILAKKPNAFKSSSRLRLFDRLIYHCIIVEELNVEETLKREIFAKPKTHKYPENYETCITFFQRFRNTFGVLVKTPEPKPSTASDEGRKKKSNTSDDDEENPNNNSSLRGVNQQERTKGRKYNSFPSIYQSFLLLSKLIMKTLLIILGMGIWGIRKIHEKKERHVWANQIMSKLVENTSSYKYDGAEPLRNTQLEKGEDSEFTDLTKQFQNAPSDTSITQDTSGQVSHSQKEHEQTEKHKIESGKVETPILIAAKMGVTEMVTKILDKFPVAIQDLNSKNKNAVLLAIENRQPLVYNLLKNRKNIHKESVFRQLDNQGNSALHLAATFGNYQPWLIPGSALQIKWEIKWYKFVKNSMPRRFFDRYNSKFQTPNEVFIDTHKDLVKDGSEWLRKTAESSSVVAALIAAVAFATSTAVPGGVKDENGQPRFRNEPEFKVFAIASLVALCFSVTSLVFFLSILTSRFQPKDFEIDLPRKLLIGLTSLFASIGSMLISFCAGHVFLLNKQLRPVAYPLYVATCFPITFFAFAQLSLYIDLMWAIFKKVPQRCYDYDVYS